MSLSSLYQDELNGLIQTDLKDLVAHCEWVPKSMPLGEVAARLNDTSSYAAVLEHDRVVGVISREFIGRLFGVQYGFALHSRKEAETAMDRDCLIIRRSASLLELLNTALNREGSAFMNDVVLVDDSGAYIGMIPVFRLARLQSRLLHIQRERDLDSSRSELFEQRALLQSVLNSMGDGVVVSDASGKIHMFNRAAEQILKMRLAPQPADGWRRTLRLLDPVTGKPVRLKDTPLFRAARGEAVEPTEVFLCRREADAGIWLNVNAMPLRFHENGIKWCVLVFRDITEQRRTEEGLRSAKNLAEQANRAKSAFLANMSHELRTPLNAIIGYSEMLLEEIVDTNSDYRSDVNKIHTSGKYLLSLINDVLDLSKIEAGRMEAFIEPFDLRPMIDEVVSTVAPLARKRSNRISATVSESLFIRSDQSKLRQVLLNLLSNACKFTENGSISITVDMKSDLTLEQLEIRVRDTGIGIAHSNVESVFEPFVQADSSITRKSGGTGLGLAISRRFCRLLGGDLLLESTIGKGSTFTVCLPLASPRPIPSSYAICSEQEAAPFGTNHDCVVVIDDDADARHLLARLLAKSGHHPIICSNAIEGIRAARQHNPLAITLDVMLQETDGWTALRNIKADPELKDIPVIMVTIVDERKRGLSMGAFAHLTKPLNQEAFQETIERCVRMRATRIGSSNSSQESVRV